jgi:hypothetical protein
MKLKFLFFICGIFLFRISKSQSYDWVSAIGAGGDDVVQAIATGTILGVNYIWVTGYNSGNFTCTVGNTINQGAYVAMYNLSGNCIWAKNIKKNTGVNMTNSMGMDLAVYSPTVSPLDETPSPNLYVTGYYDDKMFVTIFNASNGVQDLSKVYYASIDGSGDFPSASGNGIAVNQYGVFVTGYFTNSIRFPANPAASGTGTGTVFDKFAGEGKETFLLKLGAVDLSRKFVKVLRTNYNSQGNDITNTDGFSYVTGTFGSDELSDGTAGIPNLHSWQTVTTNGYVDIFVAKFNNSTGPSTNQWIRNAGSSINGTDNDMGYGINQDPSGNIYLTGTLEANANFDGLSVSVPTQPAAFIAKYNSTGSPQWATNLYPGPLTNVHGYGIFTDASYSYLCGNEFYGKVDNSTGAIATLFGIGTPAGGVAGNDILKIGSNIYFVGQEASFISTFMGTAISADYGNWDGFVTKLDPTGLRTDENNPDHQTWTCYPNPSKGSFYISSSNSLDESTAHLIRVFNLSGAKVYENSITGNSTFIQLDKPNAGIYYLQITDDNGDVSNQTIEILK